MGGSGGGSVDGSRGCLITGGSSSGPPVLTKISSGTKQQSFIQCQSLNPTI